MALASKAIAKGKASKKGIINYPKDQDPLRNVCSTPLYKSILLLPSYLKKYPNSFHHRLVHPTTYLTETIYQTQYYLLHPPQTYNNSTENIPKSYADLSSASTQSIQTKKSTLQNPNPLEAKVKNKLILEN